MTFGTTHIDDLDQLGPDAGPKSEGWAEMLTGIMEQIVRLRRGLLAIQCEQAELEAAGMFPAIPTEIWEDRGNTTHGQKKYLRLGFPGGALGGGKRKLYIGSKKAKITKARQMAARRREWEALEKERVRLERFLRMTRGSLEREAGSVRRYEIAEELGLEMEVTCNG